MLNCSEVISQKVLGLGLPYPDWPQGGAVGAHGFNLPMGHMYRAQYYFFGMFNILDIDDFMHSPIDRYSIQIFIKYE